MIKFSHLGTLSILTLTAVFAYSGCATVDSNNANEEDPPAGDIAEVDAEEDLGEAQDAVTVTCANYKDTKWQGYNSTNQPTYDWIAIEKKILELVNNTRQAGLTCKKSNGTTKVMPKVDPLTLDTNVRCAARFHSKYMLDNNKEAAHLGIGDGDQTERVLATGYQAQLVGEVIATSGNNKTTNTEKAEAIVHSWKQSYTHCVGIMAPNMKVAGVGYYYKSPTSTDSPIRATMNLAIPPKDPCPHNQCTTGGKLDPSCNSCVAAICQADSFCCNNYWDKSCVKKVATVCNQTCP